MRTTIFLYILTLGSVLLAACCSVTDSTVNDGYPYGAYHELRFDVVKMKFAPYGQRVLSYLDSQHISYFTDKTTCDKVLRVIDSTCDCSNEDLTGKALIYIYGSMDQGHIITDQPRILINHKTKEYLIELRGYGKSCHEEKPISPGPSHIFSKWAIVPRPPEGYKIVRKNFAPYTLN